MIVWKSIIQKNEVVIQIIFCGIYTYLNSMNEVSAIFLMMRKNYKY